MIPPQSRASPELRFALGRGNEGEMTADRFSRFLETLRLRPRDDGNPAKGLARRRGKWPSDASCTRQHLSPLAHIPSDQQRCRPGKHDVFDVILVAGTAGGQPVGPALDKEARPFADGWLSR